MRYIQPRTLEEAVRALAHGGTALAGGTVVTPGIASGGESIRALVDLGRLESLRRLSRDGGELVIGALTTLARIAVLPELAPGWSALALAASTIGNPNVRRSATVGGNIALRVPTPDLCPALLVLDAEVELCSLQGDASQGIEPVVEHGVPAGALIARVRVPRVERARSSSVKLGWRNASARSIVTVAASLRIEEDRVERVRLAAAGLRLHPSRMRAAEDALLGRPWSPALAEDAARVAAAELACELCEPPGEAYRRRLVAAGVVQALTRAARS